MQIAASILVLAIGFYFVVFVDAGDMRVFGWVLVGAGLLGLVSRLIIARQRDDRDPPRR